MASMTPTETALKLSLSLPQPVDVKFWVFSKRNRVSKPGSSVPQTVVCEPLEVFGISSILRRTDYFEKLLSNGFLESTKSTHFYSPFPEGENDYIDDYDYESDSDLDVDESEFDDDDSPAGNFKASQSSSPSKSESDDPDDTMATKAVPMPVSDKFPPATEFKSEESSFSNMLTNDSVGNTPIESAIPSEGLGPRCQQIIIKDTAFLTWRSLIYYLYTDQVTFLDLRSSGLIQRRVSTKNLLSNLKNPSQAPACSPKSMYRLAEKLGLEDLQKLALGAIKTRLFPHTVFTEAFSIFTSGYPPVIETELAYLCDNYDCSAIQDRWPAVVRKLLDEHFVHANDVLTILLRTKLAPRPKFSRPETPPLAAIGPSETIRSLPPKHGSRKNRF
ncbi:hypothetical protein BDY19DRAFT_921461 [Irpex rosettiformis]|uniref:Uncharacterized protein n=1 Tax=Irpex rosettiformis TaxID=378272 RepID=A0ACB8UF17_9APHY|nr:hypothetical protein BDY19DRAFT_921461 [Irpex rosettiformis]